MEKGLVSIITPCYNGAKYIAETIESVQSQSYANWEMLIIDDGSKDNSKEVVSKYSDNDNRIKYIRQENAGSAAARNNGIRRANGQYIALLDSDDLWLKDFLSEQIKFMNGKKVSCVFCSYSRIDENSKEIQHPTKAKTIVTVKDMEVMNHIGCLSGLYDISKYGKVYLHEELNSIRDDYAYWYDIVKLSGNAYGNPKVLAKYRVLPNSTTGNKKKLVVKQYKFYRGYLEQNMIQALSNVIRWGISGIIKFR